MEQPAGAPAAAPPQPAPAPAQPAPDMQVKLPDGSVRGGVRSVTSPMSLLREIPMKNEERKSVVVARVTVAGKAELWDLTRPLEGDCEVAFLNWDTPEGLHVFLHSSAHVLGAALHKLFHVDLAVGPALEDSFYYEGRLPDGRPLSASDFEAIEAEMKSIARSNVPFERLVVTKEAAQKMFENAKYKQVLIASKVDTPTCTVYKCGEFLDLCVGPHLPSVSLIKFFKLTKVSSAYFLGNADQDSLQRVYGVSFPTSAAFEEWNKFQEEAAKRDHRLIGQKQELFFFHDLSPGSCFFLPRGALIYNRLVAFMRSQYRKWGFQEVISPNVYNKDLWETSGHWAHYKDNMFTFNVEGAQYGIKPMNCPGHCLMYQVRPRSYRELPLRLAEFGICHRNELSGTLHGLTRVRRFMQDDAHIFLAPDQIGSELQRCLEFMDWVYGTMHLEYHLELSTRPEHYMGALSDWDSAEAQLVEALHHIGHQFKINPGDGAFYGPKIDIKVLDALRRPIQCATIQLDFQLPQRFNLLYTKAAAGGDEEAKPEAAASAPAADSAAAEAAPAAAGAAGAAATPAAYNPNTFGRVVMIHRAILGSLERFIGMLCEHFAGKWPFWLSPRQVAVVPVSEKYFGYARHVVDELASLDLAIDVDETARKVPKKVREAQVAQYNYIVVVGAEEEKNGTLSLRIRDMPEGAKPQVMTVAAARELFASLIAGHQ